ncbi:cellulase family glycosylhydrolase [Cohnella sp. CFH 77786]|uniref:cellulase family glycosylhydrolase n=1 Tax=Cohnella sp. CFH 77786 TaxID=2662265 RepID=UPI001C60B66E|nr:cellulase family glycosylhydrolase [Cohnella sp. CFH 77786]MBW5445160.1 cellulase family glycosylhydrolase [Cohnella sp. CFH 77786]
MSMKKTYLSLLLAVAMLLSLLPFTPSSSAATAMQSYVSAMQPGWNLGNTLDATGADETSWGNPVVTQAFVQQIAAQGFKSIRIPVTWMQHTGPAPGYTVDPAWMSRVQQIVDWSLQAGLYVMINMHHDSWQWVNTMPANHDAVLAEYKAVWTQIANRFKNHSNNLMFESINEPVFDGVDDATQFSLLDELNTAFYNVVRGTGGGNATRPLVLPTLHTGSGQTYFDSLNATITKLNDPNLIATVHYYGLWHFSVNIAGYTKFDQASIDHIVNQIDGVYNAFVSKGIPVIIGEYGLLGWDSGEGVPEHGEMLKFIENFTQYARSKGVTHMLWDNGRHFNRTTYQWRDPDLYNVIMQSMTGRSSTANTDLIFLKSGTAVQDAVLDLNLNGNSFVSLKDGSATLSPGTDYTLSGSVLTVKASALAKYASGSFGEKTVLTANFNAGPAWKIHVRYTNKPVQSQASGTIGGGLVIPTSFNGDLLATMEAVYASGGNAGPQNWTSYKEFNYTFTPDYANNTITIKPTFFAETTGGTINLTFHFWSGQIVKYQISLKGNRVTGKPM